MNRKMDGGARPFVCVLVSIHIYTVMTVYIMIYNVMSNDCVTVSRQTNDRNTEAEL